VISDRSRVDCDSIENTSHHSIYRRSRPILSYFSRYSACRVYFLSRVDSRVYKYLILISAVWQPLS